MTSLDRHKSRKAFRLKVKDTPHGKGVFSTSPISKGNFLLRFRGKVFTNASAPPALNAPLNHYLQVGLDAFLGPSRGLDDYVNHSCDPNAGVKIGPKGVFLFAIKNIGPDEEITFDYSTTMAKDDWAMPCHCQSPNCRKTIGEFSGLPRNVKQRYKALRIVPRYVRALEEKGKYLNI